jgi:hypothetical protein
MAPNREHPPGTAELLEAARRAVYLEQKRLYEEIAEQWISIADELERQSREP